MAGEITNKYKLEGNDYEGFSIQTDAAQIKDPGAGGALILRHWFFKAEPIPKGQPRPTKLQIISHFKRLIETSLWADGLIIREDKPLEYHTRRSIKSVSKTLYKKMIEENADFVILALAVPRKGVSVLETPLIAK